MQLPGTHFQLEDRCGGLDEFSIEVESLVPDRLNHDCLTAVQFDITAVDVLAFVDQFDEGGDIAAVVAGIEDNFGVTVVRD